MYVQDFEDKHKIPSGRRPDPARPGPSPAQARGSAQAGPGPRGPWLGLGLGPGLGRAGGRLLFWIYLGYI